MKYSKPQLSQLGATILLATLTGTAAAATIGVASDRSIALRNDGTILSWGGDSTVRDTITNYPFVYTSVPLRARGLPAAQSLAAGQGFSLIILPDKTVAAWGKNSEGQLGNGNTTSSLSSSSSKVKFLTDVDKIAAGDVHSLALTASGAVYAWGTGSEGQLGLGSELAITFPQPVTGLSSGVKAIAVSWSNSYAVKADGTVWAWGSNTDGQLGDSQIANSRIPIQVNGATGVTAIAAGSNFVVALRTDGTAISWGSNYRCQLGHAVASNEPCTSSSTPKKVQNLSNVAAVAAGRETAYFLLTDGSVRSIGSNAVGVLGANQSASTTFGSNDATSKFPVTADGVLLGKFVVEIAASAFAYHVLARDNTGAVYAWGSSYFGENGDGLSGPDNNGQRRSNLTATQVLGLGGDNYLNLNDATCQSGLTQVSTNLVMSVPCLNFSGANYSAKFLFDPNVTQTNGGVPYFKLSEATPK